LQSFAEQVHSSYPFLASLADLWGLQKLKFVFNVKVSKGSGVVLD
jgi:hypothetical protein